MNIHVSFAAKPPCRTIRQNSGAFLGVGLASPRELVTHLPGNTCENYVPIRLYLIADPLVRWEEGSDPSLKSVEIEYEPSPGFDQTVLDFIHNGGFTRHLCQCVGPLVNLERLWISLPK
jgi:hypothetical protein